MSRKQNTPTQGFAGTIKKFFLSAFVVITFMAYLIHEHITSALAATPTSTAPNSGAVPVPTTPNPNANALPTMPGFNSGPASNATTAPVATSGPTTALYKNGTYTGPSVNVFYGLVQVQVVVQNGQISNVTFLDYPHDRQTSQMINNQAMPWLTQEAIQAQSANINFISGATLTSEGFVNSLQAALVSAHN